MTPSHTIVSLAFLVADETYHAGADDLRPLWTRMPTFGLKEAATSLLKTSGGASDSMSKRDTGQRKPVRDDLKEIAMRRTKVAGRP
jgi:hypothetical protein